MRWLVRGSGPRVALARDVGQIVCTMCAGPGRHENVPVTSTPPTPDLTIPQFIGRLWAFVRRPGPWGGDGVLALVATCLGLYLAVQVTRVGDAPVIPRLEGVVPVVRRDGLQGLDTWQAVLSVVGTGAVAWRRSRPITAFAAQACAVLLIEDEYVNSAVVFALVVGGYSVAAHVASATTSTWVTAIATLGLVARFPEDKAGLPGMMVVTIMTTTWVTGRTVGTWRRRAGVLHRRALRAEHEREIAVAQERARIARELHDVVSHNVSVMVIQTGAARMTLRSDPDAATEALRAVEASGRETMAELRQMLDVLTEGAPTGSPPVPGVAAAPLPDGDALGPPLAPQPDLARLPVLIERVRTAGVDVRLTTSGEAHPLPPGVELTAYRVVQEALTNALKYAPGSRSAVTLTYAPDLLFVEVTDTGPAEGRLPDPLGAGRGLIGLTQRVALHHGTFQAGPRPTGGFRVEAAIPVRTA